jgi:hypothetical protein
LSIISMKGSFISSRKVLGVLRWTRASPSSSFARDRCEDGVHRMTKRHQCWDPPFDEGVDGEHIVILEDAARITQERGQGTLHERRARPRESADSPPGTRAAAAKALAYLGYSRCGWKVAGRRDDAKLTRMSSWPSVLVRLS